MGASPSGSGRACPASRRQLILAAAAAVDPSLPAGPLAAAVDSVLTSAAVSRDLAAALAADPEAITAGAPPVIGRLVSALRAAGSTLPEPVCAVCGRAGRPLTRSAAGGVCARCRRWQLARPCSRCQAVKPVAGRDAAARPVCARCADRPQRQCGQCGRVRRIARRAGGGRPDICDSCFRLPAATCARCGRHRPCSFSTGPAPICTACAPRRTVACAHCGVERPATANWPEGPVCGRCYTAALRRRGTCAGCSTVRRLVAPAGPAATTCADCAGVPASHRCSSCGIEDKLYERGSCQDCSLRRRTAKLLAAGGDSVPPALVPIYQAITTTAAPRTALNWLRNGAGAVLLAELAAGSLTASHQALDAHPRTPAAAYLREMLVANGVLPVRDEALAATERFLTAALDGITRDSDRRVVHAYGTWWVLHRLRRTAEHTPRPRTYTRHAHVRITAAARFLDWLNTQHRTLADATQADVEDWLAGGPARYDVRDFLRWAHQHGHCRPLDAPAPASNRGAATNADERWTLAARLLHDDTIELTDRVAGSLLLLYGQQLSRITAITTDQITSRDGQTFLRFGHAEVTTPEPLGGLLQALARDGRRYRGVGSPTDSRWLFPGLLPGRPLTPSRLGERLRALGVYAQPGRRAALLSLAAQLPAAVIADLLNIAPTTAARWVHHAGGNWSRYAAQLAQARNHQP